jgi:hypothetical protein
MKAIRNTEVAVNKVGIIKTPCPVPLINGRKELRNIKCSASVVLWKLARKVEVPKVVVIREEFIF